MPRRAKKEEVAEEVAPEVVETEEATEVEEVAEEKAKEAKVYNDNGQFVRTYSEEAHGKDYDKLAKEFVARRPGYTIK